MNEEGERAIDALIEHMHDEAEKEDGYLSFEDYIIATKYLGL